MQNKSPVKEVKYDYSENFGNIAINNDTVVKLTNEEPYLKPMEMEHNQEVPIAKVKQMSSFRSVVIKGTVKNLSSIKYTTTTDGSQLKKEKSHPCRSNRIYRSYIIRKLGR